MRWWHQSAAAHILSAMSESGSEPGDRYTWAELRALHVEEWRKSPKHVAPILHNMMPVVGVLLLGWSASLTLFSLWLDGFVGLSLLMAGLARRANIEIRAEGDPTPPRGCMWALFMGIFGIPYYIAFGARGADFVEAIATELVASASWLSALILLAMLVSAVISIGVRYEEGLDDVVEINLKQLNKKFFVHILRAVAVMVLCLADGAPTVLVVLLAFAYAYLEALPSSAIRFVFGRENPLDSNVDT